MNNFCSFLIKEGTLKEDDLVQAFIIQAGECPSLPKLIKDNNLLNDDQIIEVYRHQTEHKVSFEASCRELKFWDSDLELKLESIIVSSVPSIYKILIHREFVSSDDVVIKLDEYISNVIENPGDYGLSKTS